mgnify:CR=1 FL=1
MEEKIICTSEKFDLNLSKKKKNAILIIIAIMSVIISAIATAIDGQGYYSSYYNTFDFGDFLIGSIILFAVLVAALFLLSALARFFLRNYDMTVTDKRVYGKIKMGNQVDLPLDSISAISKISFMYGICVTSSSGQIKFYGIKNWDEMYSAINKLLIERQNNRNSLSSSAPISAPTKTTSSSDDLIKLKELLDQGIITQEEFDAKKKQILGI